jgi:hypothetical protein
MLVQVQTLRGNAGVQAAIDVVQAAVAKHNTANPNAQHTVATFTALAPNTKGMQLQLSLLAVMARSHGCTLVRLSVHNGNVALCGPAANVATVQANWVPTYNAISTLAAATYNPAAHGSRMAFTNGFSCGLTGGMQAALPPAQLAYGVGYLFTLPAPGNGSAYALGVKQAATITAVAMAATPNPATPRATKPATKPAAKVA